MQNCYSYWCSLFSHCNSLCHGGAMEHHKISGNIPPCQRPEVKVFDLMICSEIISQYNQGNFLQKFFLVQPPSWLDLLQFTWKNHLNHQVWWVWWEISTTWVKVIINWSSGAAHPLFYLIYHQLLIWNDQL